MSADPVVPDMLHGDQWKNVGLVQNWKAGRRKNLEKKWAASKSKFAPPIISGVVFTAAPFIVDPALALAKEMAQWEEETLTHRARRLEDEGQHKKPMKAKGGCHYQPPAMLAKDGEEWILSPIAARHATPGKLAKSKALWDKGLHSKAERELACGILGGEVECANGHKFRAGYECENRYCVTCGPMSAGQLYAKHHDRMFFVVTRLLMCCGSDSWGNCCDECSKAIEGKQLPHWPPGDENKRRPRAVLATIDFTLKNTGHASPELMRLLNGYIKKFVRALERRLKIKRSEYGLAYCDELGANNTNAHAHGVYVGPWLPQKQLVKLWKEVTGGSFIIYIKYAKDFGRALFHAVKYPAKFAERSTPERLAELERVFHRVRRFHTLASFYAPEAPPAPDPPLRVCPICDAPLSKMGPWRSIADMVRRGLKDLSTVRREVEKERGPTGAGPPVTHTAERNGVPAIDGVDALPA